MSGWGDFTNFATSALKSAQKKIDKVLEIEDDPNAEPSPEHGAPSTSLLANPAVARLQDDFFTAFGLSKGESAAAVTEDTKDESREEEEKSEAEVEVPLEVRTEPEMGEASGSGSGLNIDKWLAGGSTVDSSPDHAPLISPDPKKEKRRKGRTLSGRKSGGSEEKRSKQVEPPASTNLPETTEDDLLGLQAEQTTSTPPQSEDLNVPVDDGGEQLPQLEVASDFRTMDGSGWNEGDWTASTQMEYSELVRNPSETEVDSEPTPKLDEANEVMESEDMETEDIEQDTVKEEEYVTVTTAIDILPITEEDAEDTMGASVESSGSQSASTITLREERGSASLADELAAARPPPPLNVDTDPTHSSSASSESPALPTTEETVSPPDHNSEEETGNEGSLSSSFVQLPASATGSPPLSTQKSETSSVKKGSGYVSPSETAASSDIEIISYTGNDNGSEKSWASSAAGFLHIGGASSSRTPHPPKSSSCSSKRGGSDVVQKLMESLEQREKQNLEQSEKLMNLVEENETLRRRLSTVEGQEDVASALANLQDKFSSVCEERDGMRKRLLSLAAVETKMNQSERKLKEKEEQVADLIREGEALSQKELKQGNVIKKLREKEKASEKATEALKTRLQEMDSLRAKLKEKEEQELKYDEAVHTLKSTLEKSERRVKSSELETAEAKEKLASSKAALDSAYSQIAHLNQAQAEREKQIQKLSSDVEASREQELQQQLAQVEEARGREVEELSGQVAELSRRLEESGTETDRAEAALRFQVSQLQKRLAEAESRNEELASGVGSATAPLLRQIDSLATSHAAQQAQWERLEKDLYERLDKAERRCLAAETRESEAQSSLLDIRSELSKLQASVEAGRRSAADAKEEAARERKERRKADENSAATLRELQHQRETEQERLAELKVEKDGLVRDFEATRKSECAALEARITELLTQLDEKEAMVSVLRREVMESGRAEAVRAPSPAHSLRQSVEPGGGWESSWEAGLGLSSDLGGTKYGSLVEVLRERLQTRDGELAVLRDEVRSLHNARDSAAARLANLSKAQGELEVQQADYTLLKDKYQEVEGKLTALLAMYGEKVEENEELRLDLQDMKALYRQQLEELLKQQAAS